MVKINFQDNITKANASTFNTMQDNIEDAIDIVDGKTLDIYSTTETRIGTWIDGKPLYRKVISANSPSSTGSSAVISDLSSLNYSFIKIADGCIFDTSGNFMESVNYYVNSGDYSACWVRLTDKNLVMLIGNSNRANKQCYITLEYTKTTD